MTAAEGTAVVRPNEAAWPTLSIGETGRYINGLAFKPTDWSADGMPIIRIQNLTDPARPMNRTTRRVDPMYLVQPGDLLVSWSATLDAFIWDREPALLNQHIFKVLPNDELVSKRFLFYSLRRAIGEMVKSEHLHGSTMKHINRGPFLAHRIDVPALAEQERIVAELDKQFSRLDEAVANLKRVKANLSRYRYTTLVSATSGTLLAEGRSLADGSRVGDEDEGLPKGWHWAQIGELADVVRGGSPRPAGDPRYFGGPVPWITVGPITADDDDYLRGVPSGLTEAGRERSRYIEPHTLLLTNSGATLGVPKISLIGGCINDGVAALLNVDYPLKKYLLIYLRSKTAEMRRVNQGAAQPNLNTTIIKRYRVPVPPTDIQHRIVAEVDRRLSIAREVEAEVEVNVRRAQALRRCILTRAVRSESGGTLVGRGDSSG